MITLSYHDRTSTLLSRLILLFLLCLSNLSFAANKIAIIDDEHNAFNIGQSGDYFLDNSGQLSLEDIQSDKYNHQFRPLSHDFLQFGIPQGNIWLRSDLAIRTTYDVPVLLEINALRLRHLEVYLPAVYGNQKIRELRQSPYLTAQFTQQPYYQFLMPNATPVIHTVYIKMASQLPINTSISFKTLPLADKDQHNNYIVSGLLIGVLFILLLTNVFLFIKSKHPMYFAYGTLILAVALLHLSFHGLLAQFLPIFAGIQESIYNFSCLAAASSIVFFARYFINTRDSFPLLDKLFHWWGIMLMMLAFGFALTPESLNIKILSITTFSTMLFLAVHAVVAVLKNLPYCHYYLITRLIILIGHFSWLTTAYGVLPNHFIYYWGLTATCIIEALIYFIAVLARQSSNQPNLLHSQDYLKTRTHGVLTDLASRVRRHILVLENSLSGLKEKKAESEKKHMIAMGQVATENIKSLISRVDQINAFQHGSLDELEQTAQLDQIIERAQTNFQKLDQDNTQVEIHSHDIENVEILSHAKVIEHFLKVAILELRLLTEQTLTINIQLVVADNTGKVTLSMIFSPVHSKAFDDKGKNDLGMSYLRLITHFLRGKIEPRMSNGKRIIQAQLPVNIHRHKPAPLNRPQTPFNLLLLGQEDEDLQKALTLLQKQQRDIIQYTSLAELIGYLSQTDQRSHGTIVIIFDNGGQIPHITQQRVRPHMQLGDQCILITDNIKISHDYAKLLGYDALIKYSELDSKLNPRIEKLIDRGDKLKRVYLSRVKSLQQIIP
ncbi:7TMR-DISM family protein [Marinomonas epiphytica]